MAILTVQQLLVAARIITDATDVPAQTLAVANALYPGCVALINQYAPMVSDDVKNLALERLFSWMWESDVQSGDVSDPLQASGALSLLSLAGVVPALSTVASLPAIANFAVGDIVNLAGVLYELVADTTDANVYHGTVADQAGSLVGDSTFMWEGVTPYNIRFAANKTAIGSSPPTNLWAEFSDSEGQTVEIQLTYSPGANTATTYAYHRTPSGTAIDTASIGATFSVAFYTDESRTAPQAIHPANRWERVNRTLPVVNPIAVAGNTDRWPKTKVPSDTVYTADLPNTPGQFVLDEQFPGLTLTRTDADSRPAAPTYFNPTVDLDDHSHGEFHCSLELTIAPVSDVNMGFTMNKANQTAEDRQRTLSNIVFASDVSEEDTWAFAASGSVSGLNVFTVPVYSLNTLAGTYYLLLVKNATNQVGAYHYYDGAAGATGATFTAELRVTFTPSDTPAATNGFRKELWAVTGALPTSGLSGSDIINVGSSQFTFPTGSPLSLAGNNIAVRLPYVPPANTLGIWVYMETDGVEKVGMFIGWMARVSGSNYTLSTPHPRPITPAITITAGRFMYFSKHRNAENQFPANTVIKIYRAGI